MQPIFTHDPLLASALVVSALVWIVLDARVQWKQRKRLPADAQIQREDKGSRALLEVLVRLGFLLCFLVALTVPATAISSARVFLFWLGILLIYTGIALRFYAIHLLGAYRESLKPGPFIRCGEVDKRLFIVSPCGIVCVAEQENSLPPLLREPHFANRMCSGPIECVAGCSLEISGYVKHIE